MKRFVSIIIIIAVLLCCTACGSNSVPPTELTAPPDTIPATTPIYTPDPVYENIYSVSLPITIETSEAPDGREIFTYSYQSMHLINPDRDVADKILNDFDRRVKETRTEAHNLHDLAVLAEELPFPYSYQVQYNPTRIDQGVLSLVGQVVQVDNIMHGQYKGISANYDMMTGDVLTLGSILYHADAKQALTALVIEELENMNISQLYDDFRDSVSMRFKRDESNDESFYFSTTGLCFYFSPYEIAPYSVGNIAVEIPYYKLTGVIGDAFFPAEQTNANGNINVSAFHTAQLDSYDQFPEIIADPNGEQILLTTDSHVQDIRIHRLQYIDKTSGISQTDTIFAANVLYANDAILLEAAFGSDTASYSISYQQNGNIIHKFLIKDTNSGIIILSDTYWTD